MAYLYGPFQGLLSLQEAADIWRLNASTLRKAIARGDLLEEGEVGKFGKQWIITAKAMAEYTGGGDAMNWRPWNEYVAREMAKDFGSLCSED